MRVDQEIGQLAMRRIEPRIERRAVDAVGEGLLGPVGFQRPDIIIDLRFRRKLGAVELRLHAGDAGLAPFDFGPRAGIRIVVPAVPALLDPEAGGELGLGLHIGGEFRIEEGGKARVLAMRGGGGGGGGWGLGLHGGGQGGGGQRHRQAESELVSHRWSLMRHSARFRWGSGQGTGDEPPFVEPYRRFSRAAGPAPRRRQRG